MGRSLNACLAALVAVVPLAGACGSRTPPPGSGPTDATPSCSAEPTGRLATASTVRWVRFCDQPGAGGPVLHPDGAVTGADAARLAAGWLAAGPAPADRCGDVARRLVVQVGLDDGSVAEIRDGDPEACRTSAEAPAVDPSRVADDLTAALMLRAGRGVPEAPLESWPECPGGLDVLSTHGDGASAAALGPPPRTALTSSRPVLELPARRALVCAYGGVEPRLTARWVLDDDAALAVHLAVQTRVRPGMADCAVVPRPSYVVVLEDVTGTRRAVSVDGPHCSATHAAIGTPPQAVYLGLGHEVSLLLAATSPG